MRFPVYLAVAVAFPAMAVAAVDPGLEQAVRSPTRSAKFLARDQARHPVQELSFFGIRPTSTVVEIWPGGGYWSQILGPYLAAKGSYIIALPGGPDPEELDDAAKFRALVAAKPAAFGKPTFTVLGAGDSSVAPPGSADFVLTFRNVHNWMEEGFADRAFAAFYRALKHGGILGVEEHRGDPTKPQDPKAQSGYVRQDYTTALALKAGFVADGESEIDANPRDTRDWPKGVWTLPPSYAMGQTDRAKYAAIGEADNFVLRFRKP
jgi:predicted methyltransferase